ncbi:MAG TPA: hypothetical protein VGC89_13585 [Pyrinomonadaceae bacterium]|jgi:hypothetical protein
MTKRKRHFICLLALAVALFVGHAPAARASDPFDAIAKHIKTQYKAKRRKIPFMGLASFAVKVIHPAGFKSVKLAIFEELERPAAVGDNELSAVMRNALPPEWQPLVRLRSRDGEQMYVYAKQEGDNIRLMVVNIDDSEAVVARVKVNPEKLREFLANPKILSIALK